MYKIIDRQTLDTYQITLYDVFSLIWSPDSKYLIYDGIDGVHSIEFPQVHDNLIFEIDEDVRDHGDYSGLYQFHQRGWAPDGERVLVQFYNNLFLLRPDGSQIFNLTGQPTIKEASECLNSQPVIYSNASWSPDGRWIVFQAEANQTTSEIFRVNPDGSDMQNLTNDPNWDVMPSWIPFFEKEWHPELALAGGLVALVGVVLFSVFRRKQTA
ncbi:MAG: hypothetical protein L0154_01065 [Chloroflexi bacterium]|nr:hypothetical protein [Chloroflexota bacterium]